MHFMESQSVDCLVRREESCYNKSDLKSFESEKWGTGLRISNKFCFMGSDASGWSADLNLYRWGGQVIQ